MTNIISDLWAVPIPEGAHSFKISRGAVNKKPNPIALHYELKSWPTAMYKTRIEIPEGSWGLIGISDELPEYDEICKEKGLSRCAIIRKNDY